MIGRVRPNSSAPCTDSGRLLRADRRRGQCLVDANLLDCVGSPRNRAARGQHHRPRSRRRRMSRLPQRLPALRPHRRVEGRRHRRRTREQERNASPERAHHGSCPPRRLGRAAGGIGAAHRADFERRLADEDRGRPMTGCRAGFNAPLERESGATAERATSNGRRRQGAGAPRLGKIEGADLSPNDVFCAARTFRAVPPENGR